MAFVLIAPSNFLLLAVLVMLALAITEADATAGRKTLAYYLQQEFGSNELEMVHELRPTVNGTVAGFGQEVVYEFVMTETADPGSSVLGYVRGTAISVNDTAAGTVFFVNNVVHYDYEGVRGTLSQQGEAVFTAPSWEFAIVGGTGAFRQAFGYNLGSPVSVSRAASGYTHIVTHYEAHFSMNRH